MNISPLRILLPVSLLAGCTVSTEDIAVDTTESTLITGASSVVNEATLDYGRTIHGIDPKATPVSRNSLETVLPKGDSTTKRARLRVFADITPGSKAIKLDSYLYRGTRGEGGGPGTEYYTCITSIEFNVGTIRAELLDDVTGASSALGKQPLLVQASFGSPAHAGSKCQPHRYPSFDREQTAYAYDPSDLSAGVLSPRNAELSLDLPDGTKLNVGRNGIALPLRFRAVADGDSYRIESVSSDSAKTGRLDIPAASWTRISASGETLARGTSALRDPSRVGHQLVRTTVQTPNCAGAANTGTVRYFVSYERALPPGSRVFVRYAAANYQGLREAWRDDREVELVQDSVTGDYRGVVATTSSPLGLRKFADAYKRDVAFVTIPLPLDVVRATDTFTLLGDAIHYVYRIVSPDGTERFDNGSSARWGNYIAQVGENTFRVCFEDDSAATENAFFPPSAYKH